MTKPKISSTNKQLCAFVQEVSETLAEGKKHQTAGLGTFSTCTRKATADRASCKMAMFRASPELRQYASGGSEPLVSGPHSEVVNVIIEAMQSEQGIDIPLLGRMAVITVKGKKPKLIFHAFDELNDMLIDS